MNLVRYPESPSRDLLKGPNQINLRALAPDFNTDDLTNILHRNDKILTDQVNGNRIMAVT